MTKKLLLITLLITFAVSNLISQTTQKNIEKDFLTYLNHMINQEFTESVDYLYPELFEFVPKEQMISTMEETFNSPEVKISLNKPNVINVGEVRHIDSVYFCKLKYSHKMNMKFEDSYDTTITQQDIELRNNLTLSNLETTFGKENVSYDATDSSFEILSIKDSYAKSYDGLTDWKFIDIEKDNLMLLNLLLPPQLVEEIQAEE
ncbi:MAG: hypothetical protein RIF34_03310 [Candidatus Kapaibacterium sp.]